MPKDWDPHYEEEQDWEPVVFKKNTNTTTISSQETPIHSKICLALKSRIYCPRTCPKITYENQRISKNRKRRTVALH